MQWLGLLSVLSGSVSVVVHCSDYLWAFCVGSLFCYVVLSVLSSFAIILIGRESWLLYFVFLNVSVLWLSLTMLWVGLRCVVVVFPDHTHFLTVSSFELQKGKHVYAANHLGLD